MSVSLLKHYGVLSSPLRGIEVLLPRKMLSILTTILATAKRHKRAKKKCNLHTSLAQRVVCFTAPLPTEANSIGGRFLERIPRESGHPGDAIVRAATTVTCRTI